MVFFWGMCAVSLVISLGLLLMGSWPVLPFAGLELGALWAALYAVGLRGRTQEVISVRDDRVEVQRGRTRPTVSVSFQRAWARVVLHRPSGWYPARLTVGSHGRQVEVGRDLNDWEREHLARELRRRLQPVSWADV